MHFHLIDLYMSHCLYCKPFVNISDRCPIRSNRSFESDLFMNEPIEPQNLSERLVGVAKSYYFSKDFRLFSFFFVNIHLLINQEPSVLRVRCFFK